jgi:hypothetical protein
MYATHLLHRACMRPRAGELFCSVAYGLQAKTVSSNNVHLHLRIPQLKKREKEVSSQNIEASSSTPHPSRILSRQLVPARSAKRERREGAPPIRATRRRQRRRSVRRTREEEVAEERARQPLPPPLTTLAHSRWSTSGATADSPCTRYARPGWRQSAAPAASACASSRSHSSPAWRGAGGRRCVNEVWRQALGAGACRCVL